MSTNSSDFMRAKEAYERVLEGNSTHAKILQQLGRLYHQNGSYFQNHDLAIQHLTNRLEADPDDAQSWYLVGRAYMAGQRYHSAYEAYQQAIFRDARNATFWCSIGVLYFQIAQYSDALESYARAIRQNPYISEVWFNLGILYESCNNQIPDAIGAYVRAAELDPDNLIIAQHIQLLKHAAETGNPLPAALYPQHVHPTSYDSAVVPPTGSTGPLMLSNVGPGNGLPVFRVDSRELPEANTLNPITQPDASVSSQKADSLSLDHVDQVIVDTLEEEINGMNPGDEGYVQRLRKLSELCGSLGRLPSSYSLRAELTFPDNPHSFDGFADVWKVRYGDDWAAVKVFRVHVGDISAVKKAFYSEVTYWKRMKHPHIVKCLGISSEKHFSIVSEWMPNGDLLSYLKEHPEVKQLPLIVQVASAIEYIHSSHVVHGDIKSFNVLINSHGQACLSDFALAFTVYHTQSLPAMHSVTGHWTYPGTIRWSAPERLMPTDDPRFTMPTTASDVYSFGIMMWEVYTLQVPFNDDYQDVAVLLKLMNGLRPSRSRLVPNGLWLLMEECWTHERRNRPSSATVHMRLLEEMVRDSSTTCSPGQELLLAEDLQVPRSEISVSREREPIGQDGDQIEGYELDEPFETDELSVNGHLHQTSAAQHGSSQAADMLPSPPPVSPRVSVSADHAEHLWSYNTDQSRVDALEEQIHGMDPAHESYVQRLRELSELCSSLECLPSCYTLNDELAFPDNPHSCGGFSDVYKVPYGENWAAVKVLRVHVGDKSVIKKAFYSEVTYWKRLNHPYIVKFLGTSSQKEFSLVSEWMPNGDLLSYLKLHPEVEKLPLIVQVASAMEYIHSFHVVHGDIKSHNVLINRYGQACLSDFGLAATVYHTRSLAAMHFGSGPATSMGTIRWSAPERLLATDDPRFTMPTEASDVYSFGIMMWEMYTREMPYKNLPYDALVILKIAQGLRPARLPQIPQSLWSMMEECWKHERRHRPTSASIFDRLRTWPAPESSATCSRDPQLHFAESLLDPQAVKLAHPEENLSDFSKPGFFTQAALGVASALSNLYSPLHSAVTNLLVAMEGFDIVKDVQDSLSYSAKKMSNMMSVCETHRSKLNTFRWMERRLEAITRTIQMVERTIQAKVNRGVLKRHWEFPDDIKAIATALRIFGDIADYFAMDVTTTVPRHPTFQNLHLDDLTLVATAEFEAAQDGRQCTEGTRTELLTDLLTWGTAASGAPMICLVNGPAGSGKTAISYTVCSFLQGLDLLGGSFFCSGDGDDNRRSTQFIFSTLARSLASRNRDYASALDQILRKNPGADSFAASEQLTNLIIEPLRNAHSSEHSSAVPTRVFVIDALDQCMETDHSVNALMRLLLAKSDELPLKFLITSRPGSRVNRAFEQTRLSSYVRFRLEDIPEDITRGDIQTYLQSELARWANLHHVSNGWPPTAQVELLAKLPGALFIHASAACKFICDKESNASQRLEALVTNSTQSAHGIDLMYEVALGDVRRSQTDVTWDVTRRCLQVIVRLRRPLSLGDLADLINIDRQQLRNALAELRHVVNIPPSDYSGFVTSYHPSFSEFLLDEVRSRGKTWFLEETCAHRDMLRRCLSIMQTQLRFNVLNSLTSYVSNAEQQTQHNISGALYYSCLQWIDHLESGGDPLISDMADLHELLYTRFLYWLEVLSATSIVRAAPFIMTRLLSWMENHHSVIKDAEEIIRRKRRISGSAAPVHDLRQLAADARAFIKTFAVPIERSCPHIYLSALTGTSERSQVCSGLSSISNYMHRTITVHKQHSHSFSTLRAHEEAIDSVSFSPDGTQIVSGSSDRTICLWDVCTGAATGEPMRGHESRITSVAFSLNGAFIVSGSEDTSIFLWDVTTGECIGDLRGHEARVSSVAFSPDGTQIVSGSLDRTVRLWDVSTGEPIGEPMSDHEDTVNAVAFSADGKYIASGSNDKTIRLWDADVVAAIGGPLRGHEAAICSVAFSSDGALIVSGSSDRTVCLWDVATGELVGVPLRGHEGDVRSVAFSPNGRCIVSGSDDHTIRLWNVATKVPIGGPLRGHESAVTSVGFSPDGAQIVAAFSDGHLRCLNVDSYLSPHNSSHDTDNPSVDLEPQAHHPLRAPADRVAFSQDTTHSTCIDELLPPGRDPRDAFTLSKDGWLLGPNGELFLWIQPGHRRGLWWPRTTAIMGTQPVMLDLSRFHHGTNWTRCFSADADDGLQLVSENTDAPRGS